MAILRYIGINIIATISWPPSLRVFTAVLGVDFTYFIAYITQIHCNIFFLCMDTVIASGRNKGLQWFHLKPLLKVCTPLKLVIISEEKKITLSYKQCVILGVLILAKLLSVCKN